MSQGFSRRRAQLIDPATGEPLSVRDGVQQTTDPKARRMMAKVWLEMRRLLGRPELDVEEGAGISVERVGRKRIISQLGDATEWIPIPEMSNSDSGTSRSSQTNFDGASYYLPVPVTFDSIWFWNTSWSAAGTLKFCIYQSPTGGGGTANLLSFSTKRIPTSTQPQQTTHNKVTLLPGIFFVLWGLESGTAINVQTWDNLFSGVPQLMNSNVQAGHHPTTFTTTISVKTTPDTLNPRTQGTATTTDVAPAVRLQLR